MIEDMMSAGCGSEAMADAGEIFAVKPAAQWIDDAARRPDPEPLWLTLWFENEVACLFADTNMGKSIYAVQIADHIARQGRRVLYLDFELSDKQFQLRYTDAGAVYPFSPMMLRGEFGLSAVPESLPQMVDNIRSAALRHDCKVLIIDNITWICNRSESGDAAGELMTLLIGLKRELELSILCLAHTPKRAITASLTQNSLAGSKRIANFMDSIFAIGIDHTRLPQGRYIKQIKSRNDELKHGADNVICATVEKRSGMLQLVHTGYDREERLLVGIDSEDSARHRDAQIAELITMGKSRREITDMLRVSSKTISTVTRKMKAAGDI